MQHHYSATWNGRGVSWKGKSISLPRGIGADEAGPGGLPTYTNTAGLTHDWPVTEIGAEDQLKADISLLHHLSCPPVDAELSLSLCSAFCHGGKTVKFNNMHLHNVMR